MALQTMEEFNKQFMANNPQYGYNGQPNPTSFATPSPKQNVAKAQAVYQGGELLPGVGTQAYIDAQTKAKMAPTNFRSEIPDVVPSDAVAPSNTASSLTSLQDEINSQLMSYLKPNDGQTKAVEDLATVRAEGAKRAEYYRRKEEEILGDGSMTKEQAAEKLSQLSYQKNREMQSLAEQENAAAQTVQSYQAQFGNVLDIGRYLQSGATSQATTARAAQDDFMKLVDTFSGSDALQKDIQSYQTTGQIGPGLAPILAQATSAGYSPMEALSLIQYQTDKVRAAETKAALDQAKLIAAGERTTKGENLTATINAVTSARNVLAMNGIKPGTLEYAKGVAEATASSQLGLNATEVASYQTIANIGAQLVGLKPNITNVSKGSEIGSVISAYTGKSIQSMTNKEVAELTAKINAIASPIARTLFGERGVLTDTDIKRVMSTMPDAKAPALMNALYTELVKNVKLAAVNKLSIDASSGRNVSGVTPYIQQMVDDLSAVTTPTSGTTTGGVSYKLIQ